MDGARRERERYGLSASQSMTISMTILTEGARLWSGNGPFTSSLSLGRMVGSSDGTADDGTATVAAAGVDSAGDDMGFLHIK